MLFPVKVVFDPTALGEYLGGEKEFNIQVCVHGYVYCTLFLSFSLSPCR